MKKTVFILLALLLVPLTAHAGLFDFIIKAAAIYFLGPLVGMSAVGVGVSIALAAYGEYQQQQILRQTEEQERAARDSYNGSLQDRAITSVTTEAAFVRVYGRARVGSAVVAILPSGPRDEYQHIIAIHAAHECDGIEEIYIAKKPLGVLNADGFAMNSPDYSATQTFHGNFTGTSTSINSNYIAGTFVVRKVIDNGDTVTEEDAAYTIVGTTLTVVDNATYRLVYNYKTSSVRVKMHLGAPGEAADATLISESGGKWSASSKLSGFCYTYIRLDLNQREFQGGLPNIEVLVRGAKIYDPRTDTTAWSQNPALVLYDYLRCDFCAVPEADIPVADVITAADVCDETISIGARYTFNGTVTSEQSQPTIIGQIARSMAGGIDSTTWSMWAGKYVAPTLTLEQSDIVGAIAITPGLSDAEICNGVTARFITSENDYAPTDMQPYVNATYLAADGRQLFQNMEFPFTDETQRCHNLARIYVEDQRNSFTIKAVFSLKAWDTRIGQRVALNSVFFGMTAKVFRVVGKTYNPSGSVELLLKEDAPEIWDEADAVVLDATPNSGLPNPFNIPAPASLTLASGTDTLLRQADGTIVSCIRVTWPAGSTIYAAQAEIQRKVWNTETWETVATVDATLGTAYIAPVLDGETYDVRMRFVNPYLTVQGLWKQAARHTVIGKTAAPDAPENVVVVGQQIYFTGNAGDADLAGYYLRSIPGTIANWGSGQPLHEGFTTVIPFTMPVRLFGMQTIMVASVDTSGNISEIASVTHNFGTATLENVVQSRDFQAEGFLGTRTDCTVSGGSLIADADPTDSIYALVDVYAQADLYATNYLPMVWQSEVFTPRYNGVVTLQLELTGNATIEYRYDGSTTNDIYALTDVYAETDIYQDRDVWQTWPGALSVTRGQGLLFRISIAGGSTRGAIDAADVYFTMTAVRQTFGSVDISAFGTRLSPLNGSPPYERWVQINTLQITPFNDGSGAAYGVIQDLNAELGPAVLLNNPSAVSVNGRATVDIGGLVDV